MKLLTSGISVNRCALIVIRPAAGGSVVVSPVTVALSPPTDFSTFARRKTSTTLTHFIFESGRTVRCTHDTVLSLILKPHHATARSVPQHSPVRPFLIANTAFAHRPHVKPMGTARLMILLMAPVCNCT